MQKALPGFADITLTEKSKTTFSDPATCELTEKKADTIAFGTYANARNYQVDILSIGGKDALSSDYSIVGTLALVFKDKNKAGDVGKFVDYVSSSAAHDAIKAAGAVPF